MPPLGEPPRQWRGDPGAAEAMARAFPSLAAELGRPETRRRVMRLMAASAALGGLAGCDDPSTPDGRYVPAVNQAADIVPGLPNHYATVLPEVGGTGAGVVVTQEMGRPIKIEGSPAHPSSLGATSAQGQAALLDFYDPDRACGVLNRGGIASWQGLQRDMVVTRAAMAANGGAGLRVLTGRVYSPALDTALLAVLARYPNARWVQWEPVSRDAVRRGTQLAYGRVLDVVPRVAAADVVLGFESDLISAAPGHLAHARAFASRRNPVRGRMSRVYAAEPVPTLLGGVADHRFVTGPREMQAGLLALADAVLDGGSGVDAPHWVGPVAADLRAAGPHALVHAGPDLPAEAQALVHRINERLGGRGTTFDLIDTVQVAPGDEQGGMDGLLADMRAGRVTTLLILGANPAYAAPDFVGALRKIPFSLSSAAAPDETAHRVTWHVPLAHAFEAWGDLRAHDGTVAIQQPQALPLYGGLSTFDILALFTGEVPRPSLDIVREQWRPHLDDGAWEDALAGGVVPGTATPVSAATLVGSVASVPSPAGQALHLLIRPDPNVWDGRHANNPWLQELPRPLGKLVWDNPLLVSPRLAADMHVRDGDEVSLRAGGQFVTAPVWTVPGLAPDCVVAWLGGGRTQAGDVGNGVGTDFTPLIWVDDTPVLQRTGRQVRVASTDHHNVLQVERDAIDSVVKHATLAEFAADPRCLHESGAEPSIYHRAQQGGVAWGMSVDLNACIGCNACVTACQAENNVPVVGREQVLIGREMHWLRIDRYYEGGADSPDQYLQPMLCMHCEDAPCEPVCPVEASVHDSEGLNLQVYNRCIGTRFCSNNCPYKVRRFNFGAWAADEARPAIARNPDVTVRSRGVMEKCTFCVQRIAAARIAHDRDGAREQVVTACQAACPTQAFTFGDLHDPGSEVVARKASPLDYALLADQNTHPRLTYEGRVKNLNPAVRA